MDYLAVTGVLSDMGPALSSYEPPGVEAGQTGQPLGAGDGMPPDRQPTDTVAQDDSPPRGAAGTSPPTYVDHPEADSSHGSDFGVLGCPSK